MPPRAYMDVFTASLEKSSAHFLVPILTYWYVESDCAFAIRSWTVSAAR